MTEKTQSLILFLTLPFAMGAAYEFLPSWVSVPAIVLMAIVWLGAAAIIGKK